LELGENGEKNWNLGKMAKKIGTWGKWQKQLEHGEIVCNNFGDERRILPR
jgi:hypothetical protein